MAPDPECAVAITEGRGLGTLLRVAVTPGRSLAAAMAAVEAVVRDIDQACSRFRDDSEVAALQRRAGEATRVSPLLARALGAALRGAQLSDGAVDPTVGAAVKAAGYAADFARVARDAAAITLQPAPVPGWRSIDLDENKRLVRVPAGVEIDLGSTAKALAVDLAAAAAMRATGGGGVLVSLGGDLAVAGSAPAMGWIVLAAEDSNAPADGDGDRIAIRSGGVATSSTTVRRWTRGGVELHHIIDPRTGLPTTGPWRTVTVAGGDCLDANIAATAAIVLGEVAAEWLTARGLPSRLVDQAGSVVRLGGWPQPTTQRQATAR